MPEVCHAVTKPFLLILLVITTGYLGRVSRCDELFSFINDSEYDLIHLLLGLLYVFVKTYLSSKGQNLKCI